LKRFINLGLGIVIATSLIQAKEFNKENEIKVLNFNKNTFIQNKNFDLIKQVLKNKEFVGKKKDWVAYTLEMTLLDNRNKRRFITPYFLFSDGENITTSFINMKTNKAYGSDIIKAERKKSIEAANLKKQKQREQRVKFEKSFKFDEKYYTKDKFIAGNHAAKTKVVLFSDPLCVFCIKNAPKIIKDIKKRDDIALYYYDFPLNMHPTAKTVIKAIHKAKKDGLTDVELKIYQANYEKFYDVYRTKDNKKALEVFNKIMKTKYTMNDIDTKEANNELKKDINIGISAKVQGTPSVLFNGSHYESQKNLREFLTNKK